MNQHPCPSCAAPLDDEGICTACGALSRGFFGGLDVGTPQLAQAVARGLDFYRLLEVPPEADVRAVARRYRQLRAYFPDNPASLAREPARRLALLEAAGRVLTDPHLRRTYDQLRATPGGSVTTGVVRCANCSAPLPEAATACPFCGTPRPVATTAPAAPPTVGGLPPAAEPVDYYALLGLTPEHLSMPPQLNPQQRPGDILRLGQRFGPNTIDDSPLLMRGIPPRASDVDQASFEHQRQVLLAGGLSASEREERAAEYELARRILRNERHRETYDTLLRAFRQGKLDGGRLETLQALQAQVRAEMAEERGEPLSAEDAAGLLRQGLGYLNANLPHEALAALRRAIAAQPGSAVAHAGFAQALLRNGDPIDLGPHNLRELQRSLAALEALGAALPNNAALAALCRGLLARDNGDQATAEAELHNATRLDPALDAAWRGLAALALTHGATEATISACRRALALRPHDERALHMLIAACLRARQPAQAHDVARQLAALRGSKWTAEMVMEEVSG